MGSGATQSVCINSDYVILFKILYDYCFQCSYQRKAGRLPRVMYCSLFLFSLASCGGEYRKVSRVVTIDGNPLETERIKVFPDTGRPAIGKITAGGKYMLTTIDRRDGAVVSSHNVAIRTYRAEQGPQGQIKVIQPELLLKRYHERSELAFDVPPEGTDQANFELTSGAAAKN